MAQFNRRHSIKYIEDEGLQILTKQDTKTQEKSKPPKVRGKHFSNLEYLAEAELICHYENKNNHPFPYKCYDKNIDVSYFEQCFYTITKIGEGSFGSVLKVLNKEDNRFYAVKVTKEPFKNDSDRNYKIREVKNHSLMSYPNFVSICQAWEEDRLMYIQMELCKNNLVRTKAVPEDKCWEILSDILLALNFLHEQGMGHFDVKLENILEGFDGLYKLSDFGLVYSFKEDQSRLPVEGDSKYMAPELLETKNCFSSKADIFSLGLSILELAGNLELPNNGLVWKALREDSFPLTQTEHLSDDLFYLLVRMMSSDFSLRPSAKELLEMPKIKAIILQKRNLVGQMKRPLAELAVFLSVWALFSALVVLTQRYIVKPKATSSDSSEVEMECAHVDSSDEGYCSASTYRVCSDVPILKQNKPAIFTSTPLREEKGGKPSFFNHFKVPNRKSQPSCSSYPTIFINENGKPATSISSIDMPSTSGTSNQFSTLSDWGQVISESPSSKIRSPLASVFPEKDPDDGNVHFASPSLVQYGLSPIRLSHELKAAMKARKRQRVMCPKNLKHSFEEEIDD